jgi:glutathione peroxidase
MTVKTPVTGPNAHPFYRWIEEKAGYIGRPHWNFYKYVLDRQGNYIDWFSCLTRPGSPTLAKAIERALN